MTPRSRLTAVLFSGVALGSTAYIAAITVSTLAVDQITGSATLAGVPAAAAVAGTAFGTTVLTLGVVKYGRRPGLLLGYALAALGGAIAVLGVVRETFALLVAGMALLGLGNASNQLARYTAAELFPVHKRGAALGIVVWAGTVGSVLGPALLQPSGRFAVGLGRPELAGGYMISVLFVSLAVIFYLVALRPDPATLAVDVAPPPPREKRASLVSAFRLPQVRVAVMAMVAGQVVMVMIMTATPLHIRHFGSDLGIVGLVMSAHTLGMFALSPLTGRLVDSIGPLRVAMTGMGLLGLSALGAAYGPNTSTLLLVGTLFLLGVGWNLSFVAGSSLLTVGMERDLQTRLQGRVDSLTWTSSALASVGSGIFYQFTDYRVTALIGLALVVVPTAVILRHRRRLVGVPA